MRRSFAVLVMTAACGSPPPPPNLEVIRPPPRSADAEAPPPAATAAPTATFTATPPPPPEEAPPPKEEDPWLTHRQIAPDVVVATMKPAASKIDKCFKEAVKRDPTVEGEVNMRFIIAHEGQVIDFKADSSSLHDPELTKCIGGVIKSLKFPVQLSPGGAFGVYSTHLSHAH